MSSFPLLFLPALGTQVSLGPAVRTGFRIGRSPENQLVLKDPEVSRWQMEIMEDHGEYRLKPVSNSVPTLLNGTAIERTARLEHGDTIEAGLSQLCFLLREGECSPGNLASFGATVLGAGDIELKQAATATPQSISIPCLLGRDATVADHVLDHPSVSRRHCELIRRSGQVVVRDLGSGNGTYVNGKRALEPIALGQDDRLTIGPFHFTFDGRNLKQGSCAKGAVAVSNVTHVVRNDSGFQFTTLNSVTLAIEPGDFVCILGSTGSGKSTLLNVMSGRVIPCAGSVLFDGYDLAEEFESVKPGISFVPQHNLLFDELTTGESLYFTAKLRMSPDLADGELESAVVQTLAAVDLSDCRDTRVKHLSGGQKRRLNLASEIVNRPRVLFLDEVTSGLDDATDWEMMRLLRRLADQGITVICVTHTLTNVEEFCDKIAILARGGTMAYFGSPGSARSHFSVTRLSDIYRVLASRPAAEWQKAKPEAVAPLSRLKPPVPGHSGQSWAVGMRQFWILLHRGLRLAVADPGTLSVALAQSILVGGLLALVFSTGTDRTVNQAAFLFLLGISCYWFGCNNASKEIVKETLLFQRERDVALDAGAYLAAKFAVIGPLTALQSVVLFTVANYFAPVPGEAVDQISLMALAGVTGVAAGLAISAAAKSTDHANTMVPIILIPQIILSGAVVPRLPLLAERIAKTLISGYWIRQGMNAAPGAVSFEWATFTAQLFHMALALAIAFVLLHPQARVGSRNRVTSLRDS